MSVKVNANLKVLAYMEAGNLVDANGENPQEITKPLIMDGSENGISSESEIKTTLGLTTDQIADLVHQANNGRALVVLVELTD